jgi:hypothetical protein
MAWPHSLSASSPLRPTTTSPLFHRCTTTFTNVLHCHTLTFTNILHCCTTTSTFIFTLPLLPLLCFHHFCSRLDHGQQTQCQFLKYNLGTFHRNCSTVPSVITLFALNFVTCNFRPGEEGIGNKRVIILIRFTYVNKTKAKHHNLSKVSAILSFIH